MDSRARPIIVIGGGVAGLAAASALTSRGNRVLLLEGRERLGGRVWTVPQRSGAVVELGAEFVHGRPLQIFSLAESNKLSLEEFEGQAWCHESGRLTPCTHHLDKVFATIESLAAETVADLTFSQLVARCGQAISQEQRDWALAFVSGFHAADPERIGARSVLQDMQAEEAIGGEQAFRFFHGYQSLVEALLHACPPELFEYRLQHCVSEIRWSRGDATVSGSSPAGSFQFSAPAAIVTVPLGVLQAPEGEAAAIRFTPELADKRKALSRLAVGAAFRLTIRFRSRFWEERQHGATDLGFLFSRQPRFPTWWTSPQSGAAALTGWFAGPQAWEMRDYSETSIFDVALTSLSAIFTMDRRALQDLVEGFDLHNWQADPFARGAYSYVLVNGLDAQRVLAAPVENALFFAGEATETSGHRATVHGAMATGYRAADEVTAALQGRAA